MMNTSETGPLMELRSHLYATERLFKLRLSNASKYASVSACRLQIVQIVPYFGQSGPWLVAEALDLAPGEDRLFDLAIHSEPDGTGSVRMPGDSFYNVVAAGQYANISTSDVRQIRLRATGHGSAPCTYSCRLLMDANGRFHIEDADSSH